MQSTSLICLDQYRAKDLQEAAAPEWNWAELTGRLVEISGAGATASLTAAAGLVLQAQRASEPVAWISRPDTVFFPPDFHATNIDLDALVVVIAPTEKRAARATDMLVRSGAFGLIVIDLGAKADISTAMQGRLVGLAQRHDTAIVCLTTKQEQTPSVGSMVSLRAQALRVTEGPHMFRCKLSVLKDKHRGPHWDSSEDIRAPDGMY